MRPVSMVALPMVGVGILLGFRSLPEFRTQQGRFQLPAGFAVEQVASHEQVGPVVAITFDAEGRLVIAKEFGEIVTLMSGANGAFEQRVWTEKVTNSQGVNFDGPDLLTLAVGPEGTGLYRVVDENGDSRADRVELIEGANRRVEDHGPHTVIWGPDGYAHWIQANTAGIYSDYSPLSPVRTFDDASLNQRPNGYYRLPEGKVLRKNISRYSAGTATPTAAASAGADWELMAAGMRNPYDAVFNLMGELFLFDSDHEPDLAMPWYRATRTLHILPGGQYGYREGSGVHPVYFFDDAPTLEDQNRGSPTGSVAYQSYNYPREYYDMALFADWSRGRVIGTQLMKSGATYAPKSSNFIFGTPLNVTDVEVGPDGNVYFSLGGRYSEGGIFRVVYRGSEAMGKPQAATAIDRVLTLAQPRSAYSRKAASDIRRQMGERQWQAQLTAAARDGRQPPERRVRALELLQVFGPAPDEALLASLRSDPSWEARAASTYYLGMKTTETARRELAARLKDADPFVQRRAAEALVRSGVHPTVAAPLAPVADVLPLLASPDDALRYSARTLLREINPNLWREEALKLTQYPQAPEALLAYVQTIRAIDNTDFLRFVNRELELLRANPDEAQLLQLVRLMEYTMTKDQGVRSWPVVASSSRVKGGVIYFPGRGFLNIDTVGVVTPTSIPGTAQSATGGGGAANTAYGQIGALLLQRFPTADWRLNREITRVLGYLQTPGAIPKILTELDRPGQDTKQQLHYADALSRFESGWDAPPVEQMTGWYERAARDRLGANAFRTDFLAHIPEAQRTTVLARVQAATPAAAQIPGGGGFGGGGPMTAESVDALIFNPQTAQATPSAGVRSFERGGCVACHTFGPVGAQFGPDLTTVAQRFNRRDLVHSIVYPSEQINPQYEGVTITRTNGQAVSGLISSESDQNVVLRLPGGAELTVPVAEIRSRAKMEKSLMPEGLLDGMSPQDRSNLVAMLLAGPSVIPDTALSRINRR
jgi:putative heme-binding domain-containing protein